MDGVGEEQQQGVQTVPSDDTAHSSLSWEETPTYHWLTNKLTVAYCDYCGVRYNDHEDVFRFVAFHADEGSRNAAQLADSVPDFLRWQRDRGLHLTQLRRCYMRICQWWSTRYADLPQDVAWEARHLLALWDTELAVEM
jgi:hypothetical protein